MLSPNAKPLCHLEGRVEFVHPPPLPVVALQAPGAAVQADGEQVAARARLLHRGAAVGHLTAAVPHPRPGLPSARLHEYSDSVTDVKPN